MSFLKQRLGAREDEAPEAEETTEAAEAGAVDTIVAEPVEGAAAVAEAASRGRAMDEDELFYEYKHAVFDDIVAGVDHRAILNEDEERVTRQVARLLEQITNDRAMANGEPVDEATTERLSHEFVSELIGFGPLDPFLDDTDVTRIEANEPTDVWVECGGRFSKSKVRFRDQEHMLGVAQRMADKLKARLDSASPMLRRKLGSSAEVKIQIPPLRPSGTQILIEKGLKNPFDSIEELQEGDAGGTAANAFERIQAQIQARAIRSIDAEIAGGDIDRLRTEINNHVEAYQEEFGIDLNRAETSQIIQGIINEMRGLGPIEPLLADPDVSEVMVNRWNQVYEERGGKLRLSDVVFRDNDHVLQTIEKIVAPLGRRIDEAQPYVDARLKDGVAAGSRVNAIIPPLAIDGPCLTIRKFGKKLSIKDLVNFGALTTEVADFLAACVEGKLNIIVSGGTGSGKTTLLNALSSFIGNDERIITVEDSAELQLKQEHVVRLESRPPNVEGKGQVDIRDLVKNTLRMRPDRIVVGECRGGEAFDMLQAMNTGHEGSMTTGHANSPREMLQRLENMVMMAGMDLPHKAIREQIQAAIDLIVQQSRLDDGRRKIVEIAEVTGMEGDVITTQSVFVYNKEVDALLPTGIRPNCYKRIVESEHGQILPREMFDRKEDVRARYG